MATFLEAESDWYLKGLIFGFIKKKIQYVHLFIYEVKEPNLKLYAEIKLTSVEGRETHSFFLQKTLLLMSCPLIHTH